MIYYITAGKGPCYDRARLPSAWNPLSRDEDIRYYLSQLQDVAKLFDEFTPGRSDLARTNAAKNLTPTEFPAVRQF